MAIGYMEKTMMTVKPMVLSIVIPFYNEAESLEAVCKEVLEILSSHGSLAWELVMVDDGSTDGTSAIMDGLARTHDNFRAIHLHPNSGQSAALEAGFRAAQGEYIATLDGDGQNDPRDILHLFEEMDKRGVDMMCGIRRRRADNFVRRMSSRIANTVRSSVLKDNITDVGCSVRVFRRTCLERIRFFRNAHRFFPALFIMAGFTVAETPVNHRVREHGTSKYGGGINSRLWVGLADLAGVFWLRKRALRYTVTEKNGSDNQ
ncbi:MAG TPA: glycosyltransferase family 2 protein [Deltaproteobacteria bacterium]|nr:glycosyltransferase family 2 protein [Deltaproteobacteria bacterium]HXK47133.1 glycosyltransferase family 2 protein [Deltaproteobacteria bacterium]